MGERFGKWELVKRLAAGGMGEVFLARPVETPDAEPAFVLKRVLPHLKADQELRSLFLTEASLAARLAHPHIARIHELGDVEGQWYLVMEYVEGKDLDRVLQAAKQKGAAVPLGLVARLLLDAASALSAAHTATDAQGRSLSIVHGDVSPTNLLVSTKGVLKLIDFGIARTKQQGLASDSRALRGKYPYLAPEQVADEDADARADQFSLGAVVWELLTQRRVFEAETDVETLDLVAECRVLSPRSLRPDVPEALERVVLRMLAKEPAARFPTCTEVVRAVEELLTGTGWPSSQEALAAWLAELTATPRVPMRKAPPPPTRPVAEPSTPFVGRAAELAAVEALVGSGAQVVTLVAPAGRGASRLAGQVVKRSKTPAVRVACEGLVEAASLCAAMDRCLAGAGAGGLEPGPGPVNRDPSRSPRAPRPGSGQAPSRGPTTSPPAPPSVPLGVEGAAPSVSTMESRLRAQGPLLLLLDGLDGLPPEARDALRRWSEAARDVTFLGTAHAPLGWSRERTLEVPPLAEGAELFRRRAGLDGLDEFEAELAGRCGGEPLIIEWVAALYAAGAVEVVSELLEGEPQAPKVLDGLWEGLPPVQQTALAQLSVFPGPFGLEAAEAVLDLSAFPSAPWALDVLQGLQELALVETWTMPGEAHEVRFGLHAVVRARGAIALGDDGRRAAEGRLERWRRGPV